MPHIETIDYHVCDVCLTRHHDYQTAFQCELLEILSPENRPKIDEQVAVEIENGGFGSHWSYTT